MLMNNSELTLNKQNKIGNIKRIINFIQRVIRNIRNISLIFFYTSKVIFTKQVLSIFIVTIIYYVIQISQSIYLASQIFYAIQFYTGIITITLSMGLITGEKERNTFSFFLSSVHYPNQIIFIKLGTAMVWVLSLIVIQAYLYYIFFPDFSPLTMIIFSTINMSVIGITTLIISTFTKNTFIAGFISAVIFFIHFKLLPQIGPINIFMYYFNDEKKTYLPSLVIIENRIIVIIVIIALYDYLIRRIRKMEIT